MKFINDCHLHLGFSYEIGKGLSPDEVLPFIEKQGLENVFLFPFNPANKDIWSNIHNEIVGLNKKNKNIHGLLWLSNPHDLTPNILDPWFDNGFVGFKHHGVYENAPISDDQYAGVLRYLNDRRGMLLSHCGMFKEGEIISNTSFYHALMVAAKYRDIKVILGHAGGTMLPVIKKAADKCAGVNNIWFETSGITTPIAVEYLAKTVGVDKIIFGSDYPWCSWHSQYYNVKDSNLTPDEKQMIFYDNLMELLK